MRNPAKSFRVRHFVSVRNLCTNDSGHLQHGTQDALQSIRATVRAGRKARMVQVADWHEQCSAMLPARTPLQRAQSYTRGGIAPVDSADTEIVRTQVVKHGDM